METLNNIQGLRLTSVRTYDGMIEYVNSNKSHSGELVFITDNPSNDAYFKEDENGNKTYPRMYVIVLENDEYNFFPLMDNDGNYVDFQEGENV